MAERAILHVDLDAFFVSCELLRRPELAGLPVAVGGGAESHPGEHRDPGRGVVAAASYEARPFGVHSALPLGRALALCPDLVVLPVDISHYAERSKEVFRIFDAYTPLVEPGSLDEAYLDVSGSARLAGAAEKIAYTIQLRLQAELGLPSSVGVAGNKLVAKVASELRKPKGLVVVPPGDEAEFLAPLPVSSLPGIGPKTAQRLRLAGLAQLGQVATAPARLLDLVAGPGAVSLRQRASGIDPSPVTVPGNPKSLSREETYDRDLGAAADLERRLGALSAAVGARLRARSLVARAVSVKIRYADFETLLRRHRLAEPGCADQVLLAAALGLFRSNWDRNRPVRLLGVGAEGLDPLRQLDLFEAPDQRLERLDEALDRLQAKYGSEVIRRGGTRAPALADWNRDHLRRLSETSPEDRPPPGRAPEFGA